MPLMSDTRTNEEWLYALKASGEIQETAITALRELLLRATLYFFNRNLGDFAGLNRSEILQCAEDCAQEALIAVMNHLSDFRGDSKFTTWAYKFAVNKALMAARHERWKGISFDQLSFLDDGAFFEWAMRDKSSGLESDQSAMQGEVIEIIRELIERDLTDKQRRVLLMMVFNEVPIDEVARRLGT